MNSNCLLQKVINYKYKITGILGEGSFAVVYQAVTVTTNKKVAIKCLLKEGLRPDQIQVQREEVQILLSLRGVENVIQLLETIETREYIFIILEHCNGDLFDSILESTCDEYEAKKLFFQLAGAVKKCHDRGIYHRDLKPENVLLKGDVEPIIKLADFGLATRQEVSTDFGCGSVRYMAPECLGKSKIPRASLPPYLSAANDVWSLGVILINLLTRKNPWVEPTEKDNHFKTHLLKTQLGVDSFRKQFNFSDQFCHILRQIFDLNPERRPRIADVIDMIGRLDGFFYKEKRPVPVFVPSHRKTSTGVLTPCSMPKTMLQAQLQSLKQKKSWEFNQANVTKPEVISYLPDTPSKPTRKRDSDLLLFELELEECWGI
jgi:serine/threonine protein kinase